MPPAWPRLPFEEWRATCDTIHLHAQVLGKIAQVLAPPEPEFQHVALRLSGRGWETRPLPAPNGSGAVTLALDLRAHEVGRRHERRRARRVPLTPTARSARSRSTCSPLSAHSRVSRDQADAERGALDDPARRGRGARDLRDRADRALPRGRAAGRARAGGAARAARRPEDAGQRVVGLLRPGGELGRRGAVGVARLVAGRRPLPARRLLRLRDAAYSKAARAGTRSSASSCCRGTTCSKRRPARDRRAFLATSPTAFGQAGA